MALKSTWKTAIRPLWNRVRSASVVDPDPSVARTLFLSSGARTGSTWASEVINFDHDFRYLFEPFSMVAPLRPSWAPTLEPDDRLRYIRPACADPDLKAQAEFVLSGRFRHPEVDQYNYNSRVVFRRRLVKETKSNLFLKWLHQTFPTMKSILLLRHPIPTVLSRLYKKSDTDAGARTAAYRTLMFGQPELVADHLAPFREVLESAHTLIEQRLAVWCVQNYVPLRQFKAGEIHVMFYESLCMDPAGELKRLAAYLGDELSDAKLERALRRVRRPSSTIHRDVKEFPSGIDVIGRWQKEARDEHRAAAWKLLAAFGLDKIYGDDPMPKLRPDQAFL